MRQRLGWITMSVLLAAGAAVGEASPGAVLRGAQVVGDPVLPLVIDVDVRDLPPAPEWMPGDPIREIPRRRHPRPGGFEREPATGPDPLLERQSGEAPRGLAVTELLNFAGQGFTGVNPPDTVGDVGPNYFIQSINGSGGALVRIYDSSDGTPITNAFAMDSLATGGNCTSGFGDPVVLYDEIADRWLMTEFAGGGNHLCVYVSQTPDPVAGGWFAYDFTTPNFPDYPKYGVWPDAYYVTSNESSPAIYALDRLQMLAGGVATAQRFTVPDLSGFGFQTLTPADLDGSALPSPGAPGIVMRHRDTEVHGPAGMPSVDLLEMWEFHVDWVTPANSTLTQLPSIQVAEFDSDLCGLVSFSCIPQPGTGTRLDPLREVIMNRLVYRRSSNTDVLVGNFVTDVNGSDHAGKRWFELHDSGGGWTLDQEGTYAPDSDNRWMGAIAMDEAGNILLGYNVSSSATFPGLRYAGRLSSDPPGTLASELSLVAGTASNGSNRYGDYSAMSVDPTDGCTFWFTGEYNATSQWSTRIGAVRFDACGSPNFTLSADPTTQEICAPDDALYTVDVGQVSGFTDPVTLSASGNPGGTSVGFSTNPVTPPGSSTMTVSGTGGAAAGSYTITITGTAGALTHMADVGLDIVDGAPAAPALVAPAAGATNVPVDVTFMWSAAADASEYLLEVATNTSFTNIVFSGTTSGTSLQANPDLPSSSVLYWRVTASNGCGSGPASATRSFTTEALPGDCGPGTVANVIYDYGFESGAGGWTVSGTGGSMWTLSGTKPHTGSTSYFANDIASVSDQRLVSPSFALPTGQSPLTFQFWNDQEIEDSGTGCYDGGIIEISTNGGGTWTQLQNAVLETDPYDGVVSSSFQNPLAGLNAWCGDPQPYLNSVVNLDAYAGMTVQMRIRFGTDNSVNHPGWYVDDVLVQGCVADTMPFLDGFESGDTSAWSSTVP